MDVIRVVVLISADAEWEAVLQAYPRAARHSSPYGVWLVQSLPVGINVEPVVFFAGGWGKIAAAASTQYAIDRWQPALLVNLGTCGGISNRVPRGEILLVERTLVYDILEQMGDYAAHIAHYTTDLDLSWRGENLPQPVQRSLLVSADRDLLPKDLPELVERYGAVAADWESAAIAWVAQRNAVRCLILRGVTDLVSPQGGEAYGDLAFFRQAARQVIARLLELLPRWIELGLAH